MLLLAATLVAAIACAPKEHPSIKAPDSIAARNPTTVVQPGGPRDWGELPFRITAVADHQKILDAPPWRAAGGTWLFMECRTESGNAPFTLALDLGRKSAWKEGVVLPAGDPIPFLRTFASSFQTTVPPPSRRTQTVRPYLAKIVVLGTDQKRGSQGGFSDGGTWTTTKWFFEQYGRYAEVFVNFSFDEERGEISEKDPDYREHLLKQLTWALRDGAPLPRTPEDDPNLTESGPSFSNLQRIAATHVRNVSFDSPALAHYTVRDPGSEAHLVVFRPGEPAKSIDMHRTSKAIVGVSCRDLKPIRCAVLELDAKKHTEFISSDDPKQLLMVDRGAAPATIDGPWDAKSASLDDHALSPDGRYVAVGTMVKRGKQNAFVVYVRDIAHHGANLIQLPQDDLTFIRWDSDALILESGSAWDEKAVRALYRAAPSGTLTKIETLAPPVPVWDAEHRRSYVLEMEKSLHIGDRTFVFHPDDSGNATEECCRWAGGQIFFNGDRPAFIDPRTMKMKFAATPDLHGGTASLAPDFRHVLYAKDDGLWLGNIEGVQ
jgi:hypothetical protein